ncbi:hypothetical protein [Clostridium botulinum]|uniref:hypothetical protein n=1 Tax=Clostridium botulinum TaxID=1491 RepID=UPI00059EC3C3|nr:hypothetical protein [Clostridium botulinum]KIN82149.1 hypothetical protein SD74_05230 [Clostridium botulinum]MCC5428306.1 hypothetical protein [Clostridium botulinum]MCC5437684.1 hypothetical protein [Clostridium botulinum]
METLNIVLSIIGCITGVSSLIITFFKYLDERPKLKINQLDINTHDVSYYFPADPDSGYISDYHACIYVDISNNSDKPICITSIKLNLNDSDKVYALLDLENSKHKFILKNSNDSLVVDLKMEGILIPLRLEGNSYEKGYLFFPFMPKLSEKLIKTTITVSTTRGRFNTNVELSQFYTSHSQDKF